MLAAWDVLERAGVPFGSSSGPASIVDRGALVAAVHDTLAASNLLTERQRVSLLAWLRAWSSEWPRSFSSAFGSSGDVVLARASDGVEDHGRYLKLRRIAREKLARIL